MKDCSSVVRPGYKAKRFLWRQTVWHLRTISVVYIQISITYDFIIVPAAFDLSLYKLSNLFLNGILRFENYPMLNSRAHLRTILCWTAEHIWELSYVEQQSTWWCHFKWHHHSLCWTVLAHSPFIVHEQSSSGHGSGLNLHTFPHDS